MAIIDAVPPDFQPACLLYDYALESLFKGIVVAKDPSMIHDLKLAVPTTHALVALSKEADFSITSTDEDNLDRLTVITTWSGRYPVARDIQKWHGVPLDRAAIFPLSIRSVAEIQELVARIPQEPENLPLATRPSINAGRI
ncbi:hypothetical protein KQ910_18370 [Reyranella sp. MMS21-HV4-11]|uniref:Uncharacterized protein n=1 Tax=Reyranella humidisoli TaxID=2849149 RepID=A0ABS6IRD3_9HYPH|nr:hypothetical protein [Reyranella sp. MMS21-HV4-11]MBU8875745.1 hypothetical protein [Reyranella sp. MMS21-HV4-11]